MAELIQALQPEEDASLRLYRRAAGRLYARFVPHSAHQFRAHVLRAGRPDEAELIAETEFIALLAAFRLFYAQKERTNFGRIANIVHRSGDEDARRLAAVLREGWRRAFVRPMVFSLFGEHFDAESILDAWMNGEVFHQDAGLQEWVDIIRREGALTLLAMQWSVRDACFAVLGLDNVCALLLGEELRPVPPSPYPESGGTGAPAA